MHVPLHFAGEDKAPGVKLHNGIATHLENSIEISCLPADLPEFIEIDMTHLDLEQTIHLSEVKLPRGVESVELNHGFDKPLVSIHLPRAAIEVETAAPVTAQVPTHKDEEQEEKPE